MRTLSAALQTAQQALNRSPNTRIVARDVFLRLSNLTVAALATNYPAATDGSDIPQCPIDHNVYGGEVWRTWMDASHLMLQCVTGTLSDPGSWMATGSLSDLGAPDVVHRPSLYGNKLHYADPTQEKIFSRTLSVGGGVGAETEWAEMPNMAERIALAAVSDGLYTAELVVPGALSDFKYVQVSKLKGGASGYGQRSPDEYAGTGASGGGVGPAWSNPSNIGADDNSYATCVIGEADEQTEELQATNFGFDIPERATILGVEVAVGKYASWTEVGYRVPVTVTWNISEAKNQYATCATMDTQTPIGAGKMESDCSDLRVIVDGEEVDRWIDSPNDPSTKVWFNLDFSASQGQQHAVYIYYGGDMAQTPDDGYKPVFDLSTSDNDEWVFTDFGDSGGNRAARWTPSGSYTYTQSEGGSASPYEVMGVEADLSSGSRNSRWYLHNPCEITNLNVTSAKYKLDANAAKNETDQYATGCGTYGTGEHWVSCAYATGNNDSTASQVTLDDGENSDYLWLLDFSFSIPVDATILGIKLDLRLRRVYETGTTEVTDVELLGGGGSSTMPGSAITLSTTKTTHTKGGLGEMWGTTWTPTQINTTGSSGFGIGIRAEQTGGVPSQIAETYWVEVTVYYRESDDDSYKFGEFRLESSENGSDWTEEWDQEAIATGGDLTNDAAWHSWIRDEALTSGAKYAGFYLEGNSPSGYGETDFMSEISACTATLNSSKTPTVSVGSEQSTHQHPRDKTVQLVKSSGSGDNKANTGADWPEDTEAETTYGGASDLWGLSLTPAEVNASAFGVHIAASTLLVDATCYVDYVEITVTYQPNTDDCPHPIVVDSDYNESSLQFFDAVTLGTKDVIVVNERAHGHPVVLLWEDSAWADPRPLLPMDIVDNYSFLRIAGINVIQDANNEDVIWAAGRLGRAGSTGLHPQEWDVVLRTKDGEHWSIDRYSYVCQDNQRSRLLADNKYVYYPAGATVKYGERTWLMGADPISLKWEIESDVLGWTYAQPPLTQPCIGDTSLADHDGDYDPVTWLEPVFLCRYDGPGPFGTDFTGDPDDEVGGKSATASGGVIYRPGVYGKGVQVAEGATVENKNPSFEINVTDDWTFAQGGSGGSADQDTSAAWVGSASAKLTRGTAWTILRCGNISLANGADVTAQARMKTQGGDARIRIYDATNSTERATTTKDDPADWMLQECSWNNDTGGTVNVRLELLIDSGDADYAWFDGVNVTKTAYRTPYCDGSLGDGHSWSGTAHNSTSSRTAAELDYDDYAGDLVGAQMTACGWWTVGTVPSDTGGAEIFLDIKGANNNNRIAISCASDDKGDLYINGGNRVAAVGSGSLSAGDRVFWCATLDFDADSYVLYLYEDDGTKYTGSSSASLSVPTVTDLSVGSLVAGSGQINGVLDDVAIINRVLTADEVQMLHDLGTPLPKAGVREGLFPGYWLWRYAGYNGYEVLLSTEGIDRVDPSYQAGNRQLALASRDIALRQLVDWAGDQDWQWLSQQKHYDDCNLTDYLYSISGAQIEVSDGDLIGYVEQRELSTSSAAELVFSTKNNPGIFLTTKPFDARNFVVSGLFRYDTTDPMRATSLPTYIGYGFGVVGCCEDQYNLVAAFYDLQGGKLWLMHRYGDEDSDTWESLTSTTVTGSASESSRYKVELKRDGPSLHARVVKYASAGSDAALVAEISYTWDKTSRMVEAEDDRCRVGVMTNIEVTSGSNTNYVYACSVEAYDGDDNDHSLEWVLEDIAAKAGVLDFETALSVDEEPFDGDDNPTSAVWLQDVGGEDLLQRDFDLTFTLPNQIQSGDSLVIIAKANQKLAVAPTDGNLTSFSGVKITYTAGAEDWTVQFHQTTDDDTSSTKANWVLVDEVDFNLSVDATAGGKRIRVVGYEDFFAVYINDRWIRTFHLGPIFDDPDDGFVAAMADEPGYIGVWRQGSTNWEAMAITQPELWTWTDGIILDQRMTALAGLQRAIRDRHILFLTRPDGALKISPFNSRDTLPSIGDQIYSVQSGPTDRIPTHVRVVGTEISDYLDHDAAAEWGITFALVQCPSLEEEEAYDEAERIVDNAVAQAGGRGQGQAGRLDWEPEDRVPVSYIPADGGPPVNGNYIVNGVTFAYAGPGDLSSTASLRRDTE